MLPETTKAEHGRVWDTGWQCVFDAVEPLTPGDLLRTFTIRGQDHGRARSSICQSLP